VFRNTGRHTKYPTDVIIIFGCRYRYKVGGEITGPSMHQFVADYLANRLSRFENLPSKNPFINILVMYVLLVVRQNIYPNFFEQFFRR
jgi:hypothetical protein